MSKPDPGQFRIQQAVLSLDPPEDYLEVMQDIYVDKTGRFELIDERLATDPLTGGQVSTIRFIERPPSDERRRQDPEDDLLY